MAPAYQFWNLDKTFTAYTSMSQAFCQQDYNDLGQGGWGGIGGVLPNWANGHYTYQNGAYVNGAGDVVGRGEVKNSLISTGQLQNPTPEDLSRMGYSGYYTSSGGKIYTLSINGLGDFNFGGGSSSSLHIYIDPNQLISVYIETDGLGHSYMKIGNTVYDYGEWNDIGNFKLVGDGVLLKYTGDAADEYIANRFKDYGKFTTIFYINNLDASKVEAYYGLLWAYGEPLSRDNQFYNNGRVVDTFIVPLRTCSQTVFSALFEGGAPDLGKTEPYTPHSLYNYLKYLGY